MKKFTDPETTCSGKPRAFITPSALTTIWFNTGTLCNIECQNCYIESSPSNDRLAYLTHEDIQPFFHEIKEKNYPVQEIGFTGGEPFLNRALISMIQTSLENGYRTLILTNAMKPMQKKIDSLIELAQSFPGLLQIRVSMDHYTPKIHNQERGPDSWKQVLIGIRQLQAGKVPFSIASRSLLHETELIVRQGFQQLFQEHKINLDASNTDHLVIFPEMEDQNDPPEITTDCWRQLNQDPQQIMCAWSRMIVKRKGQNKPQVLSCTLLPYDPQFELGTSLEDSLQPIYLNHPYCAQFCVLGGGTCS